MNKLKSRKFLVWLAWLILSVIALFRPDVPKDIFTYFGLISMVYIGGNVASQFSPLCRKEVEATKEGEK